MQQSAIGHCLRYTSHAHDKIRNWYHKIVIEKNPSLISSATKGRHGAPAKTRTRETEAKYARDIRVNECDGCSVHQSRNTIDKTK